jgi:hypothetical protein
MFFLGAVTFERPIDLPESEFGSEKAVTRNAVRPVSREMDYTPAKRHYTPAQLVVSTYVSKQEPAHAAVTLGALVLYRERGGVGPCVVLYHCRQRYPG